MSTPTPGAVKAAEKLQFSLGYEKADIPLVSRIIDRVAVQPAVAELQARIQELEAAVDWHCRNTESCRDDSAEIALRVSNEELVKLLEEAERFIPDASDFHIHLCNRIKAAIAKHTQ